MKTLFQKMTFDKDWLGWLPNIPELRAVSNIGDYERAILKLANEKIAPEVAHRGIRAVGAYLRQMGYTYTRQFLIDAAKSMK